MITAYVACLIFGGVLTLASFLTGGGDADSDVSTGGTGETHDSHGTANHAATGLLPFLSLRFWIFFITFFGLTGSGLTWLGAAGAGLIAGVAVAAGLAAGYTASLVLQSLTAKPIGLLGDAASHVGREAKLLLPLSRSQRSKVRLNIGGISTDLVAETESDQPLAPGAHVLIVAVRGTVALVEPVPGSRELPPRSTAGEPTSKPPTT